MTTKTRTIAGHEVTLEVGKWYIATRPMGVTRSGGYPVSIRDRSGRAVAFLPADYELANLFIAEFNNGEMSFDGRTWE